MIEDIDEQIKSANMVLVMVRSNGDVVKLMKTVYEEDVVSKLYIPQIDLTLYGQNVGESAHGVLYKKFSFNFRPDEEVFYQAITNDFLLNGWDFFVDTLY